MWLYDTAVGPVYARGLPSSSSSYSERERPVVACIAIVPLRIKQSVEGETSWLPSINSWEPIRLIIFMQFSLLLFHPHDSIPIRILLLCKSPAWIHFARVFLCPKLSSVCSAVETSFQKVIWSPVVVPVPVPDHQNLSPFGLILFYWTLERSCRRGDEWIQFVSKVITSAFVIASINPS